MTTLDQTRRGFLGLAAGTLALATLITVPSITIGSDFDGARADQEAPKAFADAILEVVRGG